MFKKKNELKTILQTSGYKNGILFRVCPKCGKEKPLFDFGLRKMTGNGTIRNQSQCKKCRNYK